MTSNLATALAVAVFLLAADDRADRSSRSAPILSWYRSNCVMTGSTAVCFRQLQTAAHRPGLYQVADSYLVRQFVQLPQPRPSRFESAMLARSGPFNSGSVHSSACEVQQRVAS